MDLAQGMLADLPPALWLVGASLVLFWVVTRPRLARQALHLVMSRPAYLVPAAMAVCGVAGVGLLAEAADGHLRPIVQENPFAGHPLRLRPGLGWAGIGIVSAALAGLIGLLNAHAVGGKPTSDAFRSGVRQFTVTIFVAKLAVAGLCSVVLGLLDPSGRNAVLLVLCLVPSLLLAPVLGAAALHPGRPIASLRETFGIVQREMWAIGRLVTAQAVLLVGLFVLWGRVLMPAGGHGFDSIFDLDPSLLGHSSSVLSFNSFPFVVGSTERLASGLAVLLAAFGSTVFVAAHFLGATRGYAVSTPIELRVDDVEPSN